MPHADDQATRCEACGAALNVSALEPFTLVDCPVCGRETRVKRRFGPYVLTRRHAIGGMSLVFVAEDATLGREVIVKILNEAYSSNEARIAAFEEEARVTASFSHPNVVRVFTTGRAFERFFIAMELMPGGHLEHHIRKRGSIPEAEALALAIDVADGLKAAKRAGLIHRDVKPGNILLDSKGRATLVDFGLALVTKDGVATPTEIWATPYYVPPETVEGGQEDFRSDIYAFGATFYHALSGKPPCDEESMDTLRLREAKRQIRPLAVVAPGLSPATCAVINRCMAYRPEDRFRSYEDLIAALKSARAQALRPAAPQGGGATKTPRRKSGSAGQTLALIGGGVATLALAAVIFSAASGPEKPASGPAPAAAAEPDDALRPGREEGNARPSEPSPPRRGEDLGDGVAEVYNDAKQALNRGEFATAEERFAAVRDHPEVLEPTGSWAACEAVAAAFLDGRPDDARARAATSLARVSAKLADGEPIPTEIPELLRALGTPEPIPEPAAFDAATGHPLLWFLAGLEHWSQGRFDRAEPFLAAVSQVGNSKAVRWLKPYAERAGFYLDDLAVLREVEPERFDLPPERCRELIRELDAVRGRLTTRGRARLVLREWRDDLEARANREPAEDENGEKPAALAEHFRQARFDAAAELLRAWNPRDSATRAEREAYLALARAADAFLRDIRQNIPEAGVNLPLQTRDGRRFEGVAGATADGLLLRADPGDANGPTPLPCRAIDPDSLISLHRRLVADQPPGSDILRRHEHAVAFDFLAGDPERAVQAATRLAENHESFRRRWKNYSAVAKP